MYKLVGELETEALMYDRVRLGFDDDRGDPRMLVEFFKDGEPVDEVIVDFTIKKDGINTDADIWKQCCLTLAVQLDEERGGSHDLLR